MRACLPVIASLVFVSQYFSPFVVVCLSWVVVAVAVVICFCVCFCLSLNSVSVLVCVFVGLACRGLCLFVRVLRLCVALLLLVVCCMFSV